MDVSADRAFGAVPLLGQLAGLGGQRVIGMARILFVDDEEILRRIVPRLLAGVHECMTTSSAQGALALLAQGEVFDVIFCDVQLRGSSGCDFASALKSTFAEQADRLVLVSGDGYQLQACQQSCAHFIMAKPFTADSLTDTIEQVLSAPARPSEPCPRRALSASPMRHAAAPKA